MSFDVAKWAYRTLGDSSLFRSSELWKAIDPLVYSVVFPKKWPINTEKKVEENKNKIVLQAGPESTKSAEEINAEIDAQLKRPYSPEEYAEEVRNAADVLSKENVLATAENVEASRQLEDSFDDTVIDYRVFFRE